jgi:hypothetical protein
MVLRVLANNWLTALPTHVISKHLPWPANAAHPGENIRLPANRRKQNSQPLMYDSRNHLGARIRGP